MVKGGGGAEMKKGWKYTLLMLVGFALVASISPVSALSEATVKVGIILPVTDPQAKSGEIEKQSFEMALEEINAAGGIKGNKLEFLIVDDTGEPEVGRSAMKKLITKNRVVLVGGGYSNSVTYAVSRVAQQNLCFPPKSTGKRARQRSRKFSGRGHKTEKRYDTPRRHPAGHQGCQVFQQELRQAGYKGSHDRGL
jgi:ABC-type branched-subunit amino acid transport system substrate-binding protein